jgi:hypothetical protein
MAKKVSKNSKVAQRGATAGSGKDHVKVIKPVKNALTGSYSYKEVILHKEKVEEYIKQK